MIWSKPIGILEYTLIGIFLLFYLMYFTRMILVSSKVRSNMRRSFYKFFLRSAYFGAFIIAFLGPSFGDTKKEIKTTRKDIFFVLDISGSMNSNDVLPSRIEKAQKELSRIADRLNSARIGLITFSSSANLLCPLTYDKDAFKMFIQSITNQQVNGTSNISSGLQLAMEKLSSSKTQIHDVGKFIILISDGENFGEDPDKVSKLFKQKKITLMTVGIGTSSGGTIPETYGPKKDKEGQEIITSLRSAELKKLASLSGGSYFETNDNRNDLAYLSDRINRIEGVTTGYQKVDAPANKYFYFLLFGLFLILLDVLITVKTIRL